MNTIDSIPSPVNIKQGLRTTDYGLDIIHGLRYKTRTKYYVLGIKYELGINTDSGMNKRTLGVNYTACFQCKLLIYGLGPDSSLYPLSVLHA